jgi:hypothetical protein
LLYLQEIGKGFQTLAAVLSAATARVSTTLPVSVFSETALLPGLG